MNFRYNKRGSTTVYLTMILAAVLSVVGVFLQVSAQLAANSKADAVLELAGKSLLSEYDRKLLARYGLFAIKAEMSGLEQKIYGYAQESFQKRKSIDLLNLSIEELSADAKAFSMVNVDVVQEQVMAYMKYRIIQKGWGETADRQPLHAGSESHIVLRNRKVIETLPTAGYPQSGFFDFDWLPTGNIPSLAEMKERGLETFLTNEYILDRFYHQCRSTEERMTFFPHEVEYILIGTKSDKENYHKVRSHIVLIRTPLNLIHIYTDGEKKAVVASAALAMTPGPQAAATELVLASLWAAAEAENDVRLLEEGKEVPVMKSKMSWALQLQDVLDGIIGEGAVEPKVMQGMRYEDYLRFFLFTQDQDIKLLRSLDLIQLNMKGTYGSGFDLRDYYGGIAFEAKIRNKIHSFSQKY